MAATRRTRRILAVLLVVLLSAVGVEIGSRLLDVARGKPWSVDERRADIENECRILSRRAFLPGAAQAGEQGGPDSPGTAMLQPYTGWEHLLTHALIVDDIEYYRGAESKSTYDICILGGSVAQTFGELGAPRLIDLLRRDPRLAQREVRIHDFAFGAYKQPQPTMLLAYLLVLGHAPDAVIEIDGFNESALGFSNAARGGHPVYPYLPGWANATKGLRPDWDLGELMHASHAAQRRASAFAESFLNSGLWRSSFLAQVGMARIRALRRDYVQAYKRLQAHLQTGPKDGEFTGPSFDPAETAVVDVIATAWEACSHAMHGICAENGIDFLHVLQPTLHDEAGKTLTEKERAGSGEQTDWAAGVKAVYPRLREAGARLTSRGVPFFDATGVFNPYHEDIYVDVCHFRERGNEILAGAVAEAFLARALKQ